MPEKALIVHDVAYHRNGICGEGFFVVLFTDPVDNPDARMVAIHFPQEEPGQESCIYTAVLDVDQLSAGNIAFAQGNSWRGDHYHDAIVHAVAQYRHQEWDLTMSNDHTENQG